VNIGYDMLIFFREGYIRIEFDQVSKGVLYFRRFNVTAAELLLSFQKGGNWMLVISATLF